MIVLDEQLLGRDLDVEIHRWYRGVVRFITDLRPDTVVKDDAVPGLLRRQSQATFVTINERDFWRKIPADSRYCVVCFGLSDARAGEIGQLLRGLLRRPEFKTKAKRMGKVVRVTGSDVRFYTGDDRTPRKVS